MAKFVYNNVRRWGALRLLYMQHICGTLSTRRLSHLMDVAHNLCPHSRLTKQVKGMYTLPYMFSFLSMCCDDEKKVGNAVRCTLKTGIIRLS